MSLLQYVKAETNNQSKHDQLIHGITRAINKKDIRTGEALPSVRTFMRELSLSRMTVIKALQDLKDRGIIESKSRVGYFVKSENVDQQLKIMLFLTAFNPYQEALYNAFVDEISGKNIAIDLYFHHGNAKVFASILHDHLNTYGLYIVTPIEDSAAYEILNKIPPHKVLSIARPITNRQACSFVIQDFYSEVIHALESIRTRIEQYNKFILIFPEKCYHPEDISKAFTKFCARHKIPHSIENRPFIDENSKHAAYFIIDDSHLIRAIKESEKYGFRLGKDVGILSYNDTPMKEIIRQGITVISTDFDRMGRLAAQYVLNRKPVNELIKTKIILRNSL